MLRSLLSRKKDYSKITSPPCKGETVEAIIIDIYDGDTYTVVYNIKKVPFKIRVRLEGIDTPEIRRVTAESEKEASLLIREHMKSILLDKKVKLKVVKWGKYGGRIIGRIYHDKVGDVSLYLLDKRLAKIYKGRTKNRWVESECRTIIESLQ